MSPEIQIGIQPGEAAPPFAVPAVNREGTVSLDDFRGRTAVLIGLFRGLHCPFCRRQIALLGATQDKLRALGQADPGGRPRPRWLSGLARLAAALRLRAGARRAAAAATR